MGMDLENSTLVGKGTCSPNAIVALFCIYTQEIIFKNHVSCLVLVKIVLNLCPVWYLGNV